MKKSIALLLVLSFIGMNCATYEKGKGINLEPGQKPGAKVIIQKIGGQQVRGELIAVKQSSLLLKESEKGADESVEIEDIKVITIVMKSKALLGAVLGLLIGTSTFVNYVYAIESPTASFGVVVMTSFIIIGIPTALLGGGVGVLLGTDKTFYLRGRSDSEIQEILNELRPKARVPDFQ